MHSCIFVITKKIPSADEIYRILDPYYYERDNIINFDWYEVGGRFKGMLKLNDGSNTDQAKINTITNINAISCFGCIDSVHDQVIAKEYYINGKWNEYKSFDRKLDGIKEINKNNYLTIVDIHN